MAMRPPVVARRADKEVPVHPGTDPKEAVKLAATLIQQRTPQLARRLLRLTEAIDREAAACLTCGRGSKREDELLLKALQAALGIAGLAPGKVLPGGDGGGGPVLIFPAGTKMAVVAEAIDLGPRSMADVVDGDAVRVTRADEVVIHDGSQG
jgi:hypothetical protein